MTDHNLVCSWGGGALTKRKHATKSFPRGQYSAWLFCTSNGDGNGGYRRDGMKLGWAFQGGDGQPCATANDAMIGGLKQKKKKKKRSDAAEFERD